MHISFDLILLLHFKYYLTAAYCAIGQGQLIKLGCINAENA